jgi:hypothetical protein
MLVAVSGTWSGTLAFEGSADGALFFSLRGYPVSGGAYAATTTGNGAWTVPTGGFSYFRVRALAWDSGSATVTPLPTASVVTPDVVRATGTSFGEVQVAGVVGLDSATRAQLASPVCTYSAAPPILTLTTTTTEVPAVALTGRTQLIVRNLSGGPIVWCCKGVGCEPSSTAAYVILPAGDFQSFPARATDTIRCRAATGTASVNVQEAACG